MTKIIVGFIEELLAEHAYERGHSAGQAEVDMIYKELRWDFDEVLTIIEVEGLKRTDDLLMIKNLKDRVKFLEWQISEEDKDTTND